MRTRRCSNQITNRHLGRRVTPSGMARAQKGYAQKLGLSHLPPPPASISPAAIGVSDGPGGRGAFVIFSGEFCAAHDRERVMYVLSFIFL